MKKQWLLPTLLVLLALAPVASATEPPGRLGQLFDQLVAWFTGGFSEPGEQYPLNGLSLDLDADPNGLGVAYPPNGAAEPAHENELGVQYPPHGLTSPGPQSELGEAYPPNG